MAACTRDEDREFQAFRASRGGLFEDFCRRSVVNHVRGIRGVSIKDRHKQELETDLAIHLEATVQFARLLPQGFYPCSERAIGPGSVIFEMKETMEPQALEQAVRQVQRRAVTTRAGGIAVGGLIVLTSQEDSKGRTLSRLKKIAADIVGAQDVLFACRRFNVQEYTKDIMNERHELAQNNANLNNELQRQRDMFREKERQLRLERESMEKRFLAELEDNEQLLVAREALMQGEVLKYKDQLQTEHGENQALLKEKLTYMEIQLRGEFEQKEERLRSEIVHLERNSMSTRADLEAKQREVSELEELHRKSTTELNVKQAELASLTSQLDAERVRKEGELADVIAAQAETVAKMEEDQKKFMEERAMYADHMKLLRGGGFGIEDHAMKIDRNSAASEAAGAESEAGIELGSAAARLDTITSRARRRNLKEGITLTKQNLPLIQEQLSLWCGMGNCEHKFANACHIANMCFVIVQSPVIAGRPDDHQEMTQLVIHVVVALDKLLATITGGLPGLLRKSEQIDAPSLLPALILMYTYVYLHVADEKVGSIARSFLAAVLQQPIDSSRPGAWILLHLRSMAAASYLDLCLSDMRRLFQERDPDRAAKLAFEAYLRTRQTMGEYLHQHVDEFFFENMQRMRRGGAHSPDPSAFLSSYPADFVEKPYLNFSLEGVDLHLHFNNKPMAIKTLDTIHKFVDHCTGHATHNRSPTPFLAKWFGVQRYHDIGILFERCGDIDNAHRAFDSAMKLADDTSLDSDDGTRFDRTDERLSNLRYWVDNINQRWLRSGSLVYVTGLKNKAELNGKPGKIISFTKSSGRYGVQLSDTSVQVKPSNLSRTQII